MYVVGIDPGGITGMALLSWGPQDGWDVAPAQITHGPAQHLEVLDLIEDWMHGFTPVGIALEKFVVSHRAGASGHKAGQKAALEVIGAVRTQLAGRIPLFERNAAAAKGWGTNTRLTAAALMRPTQGRQHARDATRHALMCAVRDFGAPDPLSGQHVWPKADA